MIDWHIIASNIAQMAVYASHSIVLAVTEYDLIM